MSDLEHARQMLAMAENDLKALGGMTDADTFSHEIFGFHAQQGVEKTLKSWLSLAGIRYPRTHDLDELFALLFESSHDVPERFHGLSSLTDYAVQFRYELAEDLGEPLDRDDVIHKVKEIVTHVKKLLEE